jgi:hypothetical protein
MTYQYAPPSPKKRHPVLWILGPIVALVGLICGIGLVVSVFGGSSQPAGSIAPKAIQPPSASGPRSASTKALPAPTPSIFKAGDYQVGSKSSVVDNVIKPGTYSIRTMSNCYWARLKGFSGELDDVIANGNLEADQVVRVTVKRTDKGLQLMGDCALR